MNFLGTISGKPLNILLVDDDDADAKAVQRGFRKTSMVNIQRAIDGQDALDKLKGENGQPKSSPSVMIVDLNMPRMGGVELVRAMREDVELKQSIVFILSTSRSEQDKRDVYDLNIAGYIDKATVGEDFHNLVNLMYCYWRIVDLP
jgi:CheY-like chemotaxis protein